MKRGNLDVNNMFFIVSDDLDASLVPLLVQSPELPFLLPIVQGTNDDLDRL